MQPRLLPPNSGDLVTVMTVVGPRETPQAYEATSRDACRMLVVVTPGGFERFLGELRGAKDPAAIAAIAGRHGISFVS